MSISSKGEFGEDMKRRWRPLVSVLTLVTAIAIVGNSIYVHTQSRAADFREAGYQSALRADQKVILPGMERTAVESRLRTSGAKFFGICCENGIFTDEIFIGHEPAPWYCGSNNVYISFQFQPGPKMLREPESGKPLKTIALIHRLEQCL